MSNAWLLHWILQASSTSISSSQCLLVPLSYSLPRSSSTEIQGALLLDAVYGLKRSALATVEVIAKLSITRRLRRCSSQFPVSLSFHLHALRSPVYLSNVSLKPPKPLRLSRRPIRHSKETRATGDSGSSALKTVTSPVGRAAIAF